MGERMVLDITTHFTPYSLNLSRREPVDFFVEIQNKSKEPTTATVQLRTGYRLAFDMGGLKNSQEIRLENLGPNEKREWYFSIFPRVNTEIGENPLQLKILEHYKEDFSLVKRKYNLDLTLRARK
ncbi:hypothetical protein KJ972_03465 [Candidatus Micrarchaeota archaeon]|nr:hypothetical protein [Candidatus Micrarchaeota archaeon]